MTALLPFADQAAAEDWLAGELLRLARSAVAERGVFTMALSGGSTPLPFYRRLAATADFPWEACRVWLVDERFVPAGHPDHNGTAVAAALASGGRRPAGLRLVDTAAPDAEAAAADYAAALDADPALRAAGGRWPTFDFVLLGMGADGHTASLFPGTGAAAAADRSALAVSPPVAPHRRVSLSLPVLDAARFAAALVFGAAKRDALARALAGPDPELPASLLSGQRVLFLADPAAQGANL